MLKDVANISTPVEISSLVEKYNRAGPRYTSYPTALELRDEVTDHELSVAAHQSEHRELSLYFHIPFCHSLCHYCACNRQIVRDKSKLTRYLSFLVQELAYKSALLPKKPVTQIHFGGGTPNAMSTSQLNELLAIIRALFSVKRDAEISIELDPRYLASGDLQSLRQSGFNRISMGIQDFDPQVQQAINRRQSFDLIEQLILEAQQAQFKSINLDLVLGLPHQTVETIEKTLKLVTLLNPDRLSIFNYAHMPQRFAAQRKIKNEWLPSAVQKRQMHNIIEQRLSQAGFKHIGMDHFAKPEDSLFLAQQQGRLHRNFQGYTEFGSVDLIGFGITAISQIGHIIAQNMKSLTQYYATLDAINHEALCNMTEKGMKLSIDDQIRATVIQQLTCGLNVDFELINGKYHIDFEHYFTEELQLLAPMQQDGLVSIGHRHINITDIGQPFIRTICMCFDAYLPKYRKQASFSQVV